VTGVRVLLVRHGQSTWNADERWQGQADPPLSALGERQALEAVAAVAELAPRRVVSSDLVRARRTAELLTPDDVHVEVEPAWRERDAGEWTGLTRSEIEEQFPGWLADRRSPPGFEGDDALLARALPALGALLHAAPSGVALVVSHGGVIGTLERHFGAPAVRVPNLGGRWFHAEVDSVALGDRDVLVDAETVTVPDQI
jgi:broad specificity phosphatase PhoE